MNGNKDLIDKQNLYDGINKRDRMILTQYIECYKSMRHHNNAIWQIPLILSAATGAITIGAFRYTPPTQTTSKIILVVISMLISFSLLIAVVKHHFYYEIELETLNKIEEYLNVPLILRRYPIKNEKNKYWVLEYHEDSFLSRHIIKRLEKFGSHSILILSCLLILMSQFIILVYLVITLIKN